ncbi:MAG: saccharopine dehydrogenase NADP-binding domain-containing protein [Pirellulales bacterium]
MAETKTWMVYGANGYTGKLIAHEAVRRGMKPILAGRNVAAIEAMGRELRLPVRIFGLEEVSRATGNLVDVHTVLHCAGPFSATAPTMIESCISARCHYLDITGEIDVIELAKALGPRADTQRISLIPAVGFDVVPTDCLAALLAARMHDATHLELAFAGTGGLSPGTMKTMIEGMSQGGRARVEGRIVEVPIAWQAKSIAFADKPRYCVSISWGDVASAYESTGIENITVFSATSEAAVRRMRRWRWLMPATGWGPIQNYLKRRIERTVKGPSPEQLERSRTQMWGCVTNEAGRQVTGTLTGPGGYVMTYQTALAAVQRMLNEDIETGYQTPSQAFGADFIRSACDVEIDIDSHSAASNARV